MGVAQCQVRVSEAVGSDRLWAAVALTLAVADVVLVGRHPAPAACRTLLLPLPLRNPHAYAQLPPMYARAHNRSLARTNGMSNRLFHSA
ncbi:hypothetical protein J6590_038397 [Homalodisca vitripennis]|nr:hypothetical protein J6590_038397 [Homalodisca vitripennis]